MIPASLLALAAALGTPVAATSDDSDLHNYDCRVDAPRALFEEADGTVSARPLTLPDNLRWDFKLQLSQDPRNLAVTIDWPTDPLRIAGTSLIVPTGRWTYAFSPDPAPRPCLFTEFACLSFVQFSMRPDGSAAILITPSAVATDEKADTHDFFLISVRGSCQSSGKSQ